MVDRRTVLEVLGLVGVGAGAYLAHDRGYLAIDGTGGGAGPTPPSGGTDGGPATRINDIYRTLPVEPTAPTPAPTFDFEYDPVDVTLADSERFRRVIARPATNADGDRIRVVPAGTADDLARTLRVIWGVGTDTTAESTVDGTDVTLSGGTYNGVAALVGTTPEGAVVAARGRTLSDARRAANTWDG
jgi:hypothetical protein